MASRGTYLNLSCRVLWSDFCAPFCPLCLSVNSLEQRDVVIFTIVFAHSRCFAVLNATHPARRVGADDLRCIHTSTQTHTLTLPSTRTHTCGPGAASGLPPHGRFHSNQRRGRLMSLKPLQRTLVTLDLPEPPPYTQLEISLLSE